MPSLDALHAVLRDVDEWVLDQLVAAAVSDASAAEVTAPISLGDEWTAARVGWLRDFHRDRRAGLAGPRGETTWAVALADSVVGSARLKRTDEPGQLEIGVWLTRTARGHGIGTAAISLVIERATAVGADRLLATTGAGNAAALAVLHRLGFTMSATANGPGVEARRQLDQSA